MASKTTKGFGLSVVILLVGLYLSSRPSFFSWLPQAGWVTVVAMVSVLALMIVINRYVRGRTKEVFISGFILGLVESYVFLIQPNVASLPALPGNTKLFFGIAAAFRILLLVLEYVDNPLQKTVKKVLGVGQ